MKRIYSVLTILLAMNVVVSSCNQDDDDAKPKTGPCGFEYDPYDFSYTIPLQANALVPFTGTPPAAGKIGYYYDDTLVIFAIGKNYNNICSKEHTRINFSGTFGGAVPHTIPMKIYGEAQYGFANRKVTVFEGMPQAGAVLAPVTLEVGLEQQFKDKVADIDFYVAVQFRTLGSFSQDSLYFAQHIVSLKASGAYAKHSD